MNRLLVFYFSSLCLILLLAINQGCGTDELTERRAERILYSHLEDELKGRCTFTHPYYAALLGKPEFAAIRDDNLCKYNIHIHDIEYVSEEEAVVEYKIALIANNRVIETYLDGWVKMAARIEELPRRKVPYPDYGLIEMYVDTVDHATFPIFPDRPEGIKNTLGWIRLEAIFKEPILELKEKQTLESDVLKARLYKHDDEWYAVFDENDHE